MPFRIIHFNFDIVSFQNLKKFQYKIFELNLQPQDSLSS